MPVKFGGWLLRTGGLGSPGPSAGHYVWFRIQAPVQVARAGIVTEVAVLWDLIPPVVPLCVTGYVVI